MPLTALRSTRYAILLLLAITACAGSVASASPSNTDSRTRILVKFRAGTTSAAAQRALATAGASEFRSLPRLGVRVVRVAPDRAQEALETFRSNRRVEYAERDAVLQPQELLPSDPSFPTQFAIAGGAWGWTKTHTTQAWDITRGDASVVVAILDTGLRTAGLDDFGGQVVSGWNVLKNSSDVTTASGVHGTYVAGVVGLTLGNNVGNAGYCPGCRIMPVQVGTDTGANLSDMANGLTWAADHGARVANMSWAGTSSSATLADAVSYARAKGMVVTAAAGNSNCNCPTYPAATAGVIGVAGTTNTDTKQGDSNYGAWVKVAAPESNLTSWPTINGTPGYAPVGGTSLAAPVVAALAGLLFSAKPPLTGAQVEQALEQSAVPMTLVQYGRVDALATLNYAGFSDPQAPAAPSNSSAPQVLLETNGVYNTSVLTASPQVGQILLRGQGTWTGSAPLSLMSVQWQRCDTRDSTCTTIATTPSYTVQSADTGYALRLQITVANGLGSATAMSALTGVIGNLAPTSPPVNSGLPVISGTPKEGEILTASTGSWSGAPTTYAYEWRRCDSSGSNCTVLAGASTSSYAVQSMDVGSTIRVAVTAANAGGAMTSVSEASAVIVAAIAPAPTPTPTSQTVTFSGSLSPKNPSRTFSVTVGAGAAHATLSFSKCSSLTLALTSGASTTGPSVVVLDTTLTGGTYSYTVSGGRCSFSLTVTSPTP